jgi:2-polyprenyl-3-methyl-5-hydroxy-6-metoxy-1,4-benzoquinol methylase
MEHIGGHSNKTHTDEGVLKYLKKKYNITSMIDVGCGPGGMSRIAAKYKIKWTGVDGDPETLKHNSAIQLCDFEKDTQATDLIWSVEFLEHVWEEFMDNYMNILKPVPIYFVLLHRQENLDTIM